MVTVAALEALGFTVGMAHGSVQVEEEALAAARAAADPNVVAEQANQLTAETVQTLANQGKLPETDAERLELATQIGAAALEGLTAVVTEKVAFHERALAIAKEMPDVWCVQQLAGDVLVLQMYVPCKADGTGWDEDAQAHLDALVDRDAFAERDYQGSNPDAMQAAMTLVALGRDVSRPSAGADVFDVDGATYSGADLPALAEKAAAEPPLPTSAERVVAALEASASLDDATKTALRDALA